MDVLIYDLLINQTLIVLVLVFVGSIVILG